MTKLLLVDDEPRILMFLDKGLKRQNYQAELAVNGRQALDMALAQQFDLMVLDLSLPELDGLGVLEGLRAADKSLPVIVITARGESDCARAMAFGAADCLHKPFRFGELLAKIQQLLGESLPKTTEARAC